MKKKFKARIRLASGKVVTRSITLEASSMAVNMVNGRGIGLRNKTTKEKEEEILSDKKYWEKSIQEEGDIISIFEN